jgi:hypothetical protein
VFAKNHRLLRLAWKKSPTPMTLKTTRMRIPIVADADADVAVDEAADVAVKAARKAAAMLVAIPDAMVLANHAAIAQSRLVALPAISTTNQKSISSTKMRNWKTSHTNLMTSSNDHRDDLVAEAMTAVIALSGQSVENAEIVLNGRRNEANAGNDRNVPNDHLGQNVANERNDRNELSAANGQIVVIDRLAGNEANAETDPSAGSVSNDQNVLAVTLARTGKVANQESRANRVKADVLSANERKAVISTWMIVVRLILVPSLRNSAISRRGKKRLDVCHCEHRRKTMLDARRTVTRRATTDLRAAVSRF